jgi:hypothetical protein
MMTSRRLTKVKDFHGGDENFTSASFMSIPVALRQTIWMLSIDGVCDRFPRDTSRTFRLDYQKFER